MIKKILNLLFDGKGPVNVSATISAVPVDSDRRELTQHLLEIDKGLKKIDNEAKRMKKKIDTALAIAISTGGLKERPA